MFVGNSEWLNNIQKFLFCQCAICWCILITIYPFGIVWVGHIVIYVQSLGKSETKWLHKTASYIHNSCMKCCLRRKLYTFIQPYLLASKCSSVTSKLIVGPGLTNVCTLRCECRPMYLTRKREGWRGTGVSANQQLGASSNWFGSVLLQEDTP